jgi:ABC-2 type transport system permease protein
VNANRTRWGLQMSTSLLRIGAMTSRYFYLLRSSWLRWLDLVYWPSMQMLVWGFLYTYLYRSDNAFGNTAGLLLGAVLLWDVLFRGQLGFTFTFLEEIWSRNLANLMMSPLQPAELAASLMLMSLIRLVIGTIPVTILAFLLFGFNIYAMGFGLIAFFINLVLTSWAFGLVVSGLVIRQGLGAESLAYSIMILLLPLCCVYYPVWVLPVWLQPAAWSLTPTYVFEGMRAVLRDGVFRADLMVECLALNVIYLSVGFTTFMLLLRSARHKGVLLTMGE